MISKSILPKYQSHKARDTLSADIKFTAKKIPKDRIRFNKKIKPLNDILMKNGIKELEEFTKALTDAEFTSPNIKSFVFSMQEYLKDETFLENDIRKIANKNDLDIIIHYYCITYKDDFMNAYQDLIKEYKILKIRILDSLIEDAQMKFNNIHAKVLEFNDQLSPTTNSLDIFHSEDHTLDYDDFPFSNFM